MTERWQTHTVFNQPPPLADTNLYLSDTPLREAVVREGASWAEVSLAEAGADLGSAPVLSLGDLANRHPPVLHPFDSMGNRIDELEFHPAWHDLMSRLIAGRVHNLTWAEPRPGASVARAARFLLHAQVEAGTLCPVTMTFGAIPVLRREPALADWMPLLLSDQYDSRSQPATSKRGLLIGMGMTEKQGGSDVRANTTEARPEGERGSGKPYRLVGHKWFFSVPQSDAHLVLAQTDGGLSCFFLPRFLPDGSRNAIRVQRLKDKIGYRSNACSEVEFQDDWGLLVGQEGKGGRTILEMGAYTRFDCALGTTGLMRRALTVAIHHAQHRAAFGNALVDQPLMRNVLADLALEVEAATALCMRIARTGDAPDDPAEAALRRVLTPCAKYWICKRGPTFGAEAMEVLGGNGYVEEGELARVYREMPVNSIWEGSGNVMCLDVLRALAREPDAAEALRAELMAARGQHAAFDHALTVLQQALSRPAEYDARRLVERLAVAVSASLLLRFAPSPVADAYCRSRMADVGGAFGTLPADVGPKPILERAWPGAN